MRARACVCVCVRAPQARRAPHIGQRAALEDADLVDERAQGVPVAEDSHDGIDRHYVVSELAEADSRRSRSRVPSSPSCQTPAPRTARPDARAYARSEVAPPIPNAPPPPYEPYPSR